MYPRHGINSGFFFGAPPYSSLVENAEGIMMPYSLKKCSESVPIITDIICKDIVCKKYDFTENLSFNDVVVTS